MPNDVAAAIVSDWRSEVRRKLQCNEAEWKPEYALLRVLHYARKFAKVGEPPLVLPDADRFIIALLRSARGEMSTSMFNSRSAKRTPTLFWKQLVELYGDEARLCERVKALADATSEDDSGGVMFCGGGAPRRGGVNNTIAKGYG